MNDTAPAPTPGYNCRLTIWFQVTRRGQRTAWYWSYGAFRAIRLPLADAELMKAAGMADVIPGHPFRP